MHLLVKRILNVIKMQGTTIKTTAKNLQINTDCCHVTTKITLNSLCLGDTLSHKFSGANGELYLSYFHLIHLPCWCHCCKCIITQCCELLKLHSIVDINAWNNGALEEWYSQRTTEVQGEEPVPLPLCPAQIPHWVPWTSNWTSAVTS